MKVVLPISWKYIYQPPWSSCSDPGHRWCQPGQELPGPRLPPTISRSWFRGKTGYPKENVTTPFQDQVCLKRYFVYCTVCDKHILFWISHNLVVKNKMLNIWFNYVCKAVASIPTINRPISTFCIWFFSSMWVPSLVFRGSIPLSMLLGFLWQALASLGEALVSL